MVSVDLTRKVTVPGEGIHELRHTMELRVQRTHSHMEVLSYVDPLLGDDCTAAHKQQERNGIFCVVRARSYNQDKSASQSRVAVSEASESSGIQNKGNIRR
jgi:hypothetical protein